MIDAQQKQRHNDDRNCKLLHRLLKGLLSPCEINVAIFRTFDRGRLLVSAFFPGFHGPIES